MSQQGRHHAILIGSSQFASDSGFKPLRCPENDVDGMQQLLTSPEFGLFAPDNISVFKNRPHYEILRAINPVFRLADPQDLILLYYSGHGELDKKDHLHLATPDSDKEDIETTSIPAERLRRLIDNHRCKRIVLILDCCYSGAIKHDLLRSTADSEMKLLAKGIYVLTASTAMETAEEKEGDEYGLLTKHILDGIKSGQAAGNADGFISVDSLYQHVSRAVARNSAQTPTCYGLDEQGGHLYIARAATLYSAKRLQEFRKLINELDTNEEIYEETADQARRVIRENQQKRDKKLFELLDQLQKGLKPGKFSGQWSKLTTTASSSISQVLTPHRVADDDAIRSVEEIVAGASVKRADDTIRSVEEMLATASVKRADDTEEKAFAIPSLDSLPKKIARVLADYKLPSTEMLTLPAPRLETTEAELIERAHQLAEKCQEFNVSGQVKQISPGPVVTTFEFKPDPGVKYSRITSLVDELCLGLKVESIRIDRIPGKSTVGIEVPNENREVIRLREVIESKRFRDSDSKLSLALGKTIDGANYSADLAKMPHLLIAGATGTGKSVALNTILLSLLYKATPDEVKLILVDPKRLEFGLYADLPHLLTPIVADPKRASHALKWAVTEMEYRYHHLTSFGVRNIGQYNTEVYELAKGKKTDNNDVPQQLPFIVIIIDELADLMMVAAREVEESITRLAQMARPVGIHLVLATQRPSVDVITGLIKANFPSRISLRVSSKVDSRTIIDTNGAEGLLGQGDMLFLGPGTSRLIRVHGAYVDEKEVKRICDFIRSQGNPVYNETIVMSEKESRGGGDGDFPKDEKYDDAVRVVVNIQKASTSLLQRNLRIGYGRAASIIDMMELEGIVGPEDGAKPRQVLVKPDF